MGDAVRCCIGFHFHQPPYDGSTIHYYQDACQQTYRHHLDVLDKVPGAKVNFSITGVLLEMMAQRDPDVIDRIRGKVDSGQVYLTACGYSHPIFPIIHARYGEDACSAQVEKDLEMREMLFGVKPDIFRLPEYAYSGQVIDFLQRSGFAGTILPDGVFFDSRVGTDRAMVRAPKGPNGRAFRILPRNGQLSNVLACFDTDGTNYMRWLAHFGGDPRAVADDFSRRLQNVYGRVTLLDGDGETYTHWMHESGVPEDKRDVLRPMYESMLGHGIEMVHLPEFMESLPGMEVGDIPTGSYDSGGLSVWEGHPNHHSMWRDVDDCWRMYKESGDDETLDLALKAQTSCWFWGASRGFPDWWRQRPRAYRDQIAGMVGRRCPEPLAAVA